MSTACVPKGRITDKIVEEYLNEKRYEQIAESNALGGGTLSTRETRLAILQKNMATRQNPAKAGGSEESVAVTRSHT